MAKNLIERVNITTTQSYWSGHRALTLKKATIKSFITLILIVCFTTAHGQRMSLADVMQLYAASINADQGKITKITQNLQADASNWSDPKISSHNFFKLSDSLSSILINITPSSFSKVLANFKRG